MRRTDTPLHSKVLMDTQAPPANSFFYLGAEEDNVVDKSSFLSFSLMFGFAETFALCTGSGQWQSMSINNPLESQIAGKMNRIELFIVKVIP